MPVHVVETGTAAQILPVLDVHNLRIEFPLRQRALVAVDDVSFSIGKGEILGVVGESGAGKSLTGSALIGLLQPPGRIVGGTVHLSGQRIDDLPQAEQRKLRGRHIGAIFQDPLTSLDPLFTVGRQLTETIRAHHPGNAETARAKALQLLREVGIADPENRFNQYPHQFSGGMRQRIVIALALAGEPELIIADEPTTALDVSVQAQIIGLLKRLAATRGTAIMLVTHDMGVIAETADRVAVMYAGRVVEIGPVDEVIHRPSHPYTAGLMASIPSLNSKAVRLAQIDGSMPRLGSWPDGCAFNPRCPKAGTRCRSELPHLADAGGTSAACFIHQGGTQL
ncbi:ABC transporter ATP-binding protein [Aminobacter aganoensis]|uniref:Peptide/nickel transport system ATP-binding protein n=2 Tax=Aminobacter aganoensis TaxID=83264 RepID=A0A7X0F9A3_9HYPH|nr:ABC transporter ATP-binding protein [Aminobacter sp. DSM 101952]MBB6355494.1 peptide/nickel transport system ATP-binding protein [Aminobacter aganoensis]